MLHPDKRRGAIRRKAAGRRQPCASPPGHCRQSRKYRRSASRRYGVRPSRGGAKHQPGTNTPHRAHYKKLRSRRGSKCRPAIGVRAESRVTCKTDHAGNVGVVRPGATVSGGHAQALKIRWKFLSSRAGRLCPADHRQKSAALGWCNSRFSPRHGLKF